MSPQCLQVLKSCMPYSLRIMKW
uniref:Uncharacterized protein n=1 Tax=Arundo donax TaxID=35708 RepID=A0A0A9SPX2_ARUDO